MKLLYSTVLRECVSVTIILQYFSLNDECRFRHKHRLRHKCRFNWDRAYFIPQNYFSEDRIGPVSSPKIVCPLLVFIIGFVQPDLIAHLFPNYGDNCTIAHTTFWTLSLSPLVSYCIIEYSWNPFHSRTRLVAHDVDLGFMYSFTNLSYVGWMTRIFRI